MCEGGVCDVCKGMCEGGVCEECMCEYSLQDQCDLPCAHKLGTYVLVNIGLSPGGKLLAVVHGSGCYNWIGQQLLWSRHGGIGRHTTGVLEKWGTRGRWD